MARKLTAKQTEKAIDAAIEKSYGKHAQGKTINVFKIGAVFKDARKALADAQATCTANNGGAMAVEDFARVLDVAMPGIVANYCDPA